LGMLLVNVHQVQMQVGVRELGTTPTTNIKEDGINVIINFILPLLSQLETIIIMTNKFNTKVNLMKWEHSLIT